MKAKRVIISILVLIFLMLIDIGISSTIINKRYYRELAWETVNRDGTVTDWKNAEVSFVDIETATVYIPETISANINRKLLVLNGGRAVRVEMHTTRDGMLGPIVLYFNPFTKQCFGGGIRL